MSSEVLSNAYGRSAMASPGPEIIDLETGEVVPLEAGPFIPPFATKTALELPDGLDFATWEKVARNLQQAHRSVLWWIGDCLVYGEERWGQESAQASLEGLGFSESVIENARWVARAYPPSTRVERASWTHHREAARLPEPVRRKVLRDAEENGWSSRDLRAEIERRGLREPRKTTEPGPSLPDPIAAAEADLSAALAAWLAEGRRLAEQVLGGVPWACDVPAGPLHECYDLLKALDTGSPQGTAVTRSIDEREEKAA